MKIKLVSFLIGQAKKSDQTLKYFYLCFEGMAWTDFFAKFSVKSVFAITFVWMTVFVSRNTFAAIQTRLLIFQNCFGFSTSTWFITKQTSMSDFAKASLFFWTRQLNTFSITIASKISAFLGRAMTVVLIFWQKTTAKCLIGTLFAFLMSITSSIGCNVALINALSRLIEMISIAFFACYNPYDMNYCYFCWQINNFMNSQLFSSHISQPGIIRLHDLHGASSPTLVISSVRS